MMNEIVNLVLFFLAGTGMGFIYFGGLWWTVRRLPGSRQPHLLAYASFLVRSGFCLAGLILVARGGRWEHVIVSLLGIIGTRWILVRRWSPGEGRERTLSEG
ncbi:MAG: ATP synthase subunit I [Candidatus Aminicenantes bacterium]|jgi:F1F0 ATPase subunit 2